MKILALLSRAFLALDHFAARHWRKFVIAGSLILSVLTLRTCYEAGRFEAAVKENPVLNKKDVRRLKKAVVDLKTKARIDKARQDSATAAATRHQARADKSQHQVDSLTQIYETTPATTALATDVELYQHLLRYRPSPFPDTSAY